MLAIVFDKDFLTSEINKLSKELEQEEVFTNYEKSSKLNIQISEMQNKLSSFNNVLNEFNYINEMFELMQEMPDATVIDGLNKELSKLYNEVNELYLSTLLSKKHDKSNAIIKIHSGAGGTEACDWANMLYRMYSMYCDKNNFKIEVYDLTPGDEAGIKSITFGVNGQNAYGYLKGESGVHRLVRISPFDSNKRRHTSFSSVEVMPEIEDDEEITILPEEIRIDTYRASGAGGQHVNKTESAVRITHLETGVVVTCQSGRSQIKNRETAMKLLKSKLLQLQLQQREQELNKLKGTQKKIEWGSQIRSYVFQPYTMVRDHRTNYQTSNVDSVMNGNITEFILQYLKWSEL